MSRDVIWQSGHVAARCCSCVYFLGRRSCPQRLWSYGTMALYKCIIIIIIIIIMCFRQLRWLVVDVWNALTSITLSPNRFRYTSICTHLKQGLHDNSLHSYRPTYRLDVAVANALFLVTYTLRVRTKGCQHCPLTTRNATRWQHGPNYNTKMRGRESVIWDRFSFSAIKLYSILQHNRIITLVSRTVVD